MTLSVNIVITETTSAFTCISQQSRQIHNLQQIILNTIFVKKKLYLYSFKAVQKEVNMDLKKKYLSAKTRPD